MAKESGEPRLLDARTVTGDTLLSEVRRLSDDNARFVTATCLDTGEEYEVVYHFAIGDRLQHLRLRVGHGEPLVSIAEAFPGAAFLEAEMRDLFGVAISGRGTDHVGRMMLAEDAPLAPMAKSAITVAPSEAEAEGGRDTDIQPDAAGKGGRRTVVPFGPQHPVLPEPVQLQLVLEDEIVVDVIPAVGYVHRGLEKLAEARDFNQNVFLVERVCGICSFMHALAYCMGIEEMMGLTPPPRANYLRVVWAELHRLHSHLLWAGLYADAFGFESLFMETWRAREVVMDLLEVTAGNRVIISTAKIGGVRRDIDGVLREKVLAGLDRCEKDFRRIVPSFLDDATIKRRTVGKGIITREDAWVYGAVGPIARASGIAIDLRTAGYAAYGELGFKPVVETAGDAYARAKVRLLELFQSVELVRNALLTMPEGEIAVPVSGNPVGEVVSRVEQPRGEVMYYLRANGTKQLERLRVRTPSFASLPLLFKMIPGSELADVPVLVLSIDPCMSCTER